MKMDEARLMCVGVRCYKNREEYWMKKLGQLADMIKDDKDADAEVVFMGKLTTFVEEQERDPDAS